MAKTINLTHKMFCIVDDADYDWLQKFHWHAHHSDTNWYAARAYREGGKVVRVFMHRQITNCPDDKIVHHRDQNTMNNTHKNLVVCSKSDNIKFWLKEKKNAH